MFRNGLFVQLLEVAWVGVPSCSQVMSVFRVVCCDAAVGDRIGFAAAAVLGLVALNRD